MEKVLETLKYLNKDESSSRWPRSMGRWLLVALTGIGQTVGGLLYLSR